LLGEAGSNTDDVRAWLDGLRESPEHREMMDLAILVREVSSRGDSERKLAREVLESVLRYSGTKDDFFSI